MWHVMMSARTAYGRYVTAQPVTDNGLIWSRWPTSKKNSVSQPLLLWQAAYDLGIEGDGPGSWSSSCVGQLMRQNGTASSEHASKRWRQTPNTSSTLLSTYWIVTSLKIDMLRFFTYYGFRRLNSASRN